MLAFAGTPPTLASPTPVATQPGLLEGNVDPTNYRQTELLEDIAEAARVAGDVEADATLVRQSALPDPYLVIVLGSAGWFAKSSSRRWPNPWPRRSARTSSVPTRHSSGGWWR